MSETIVPRRTYLWVAAWLIALLALTVVLSKVFSLGVLGTVLTLGIAVAKAALVVLFFMHLRYGAPIMRLFAAAGLLWLAILMGFTVGDYLTRAGGWAEHIRSNPPVLEPAAPK